MNVSAVVVGGTHTHRLRHTHKLIKHLHHLHGAVFYLIALEYHNMKNLMEPVTFQCTSTERVIGRRRSSGPRRCGEAVWSGIRSLLLPPPDDDHAGGIGRSQQALVTVEAHVQNRTPVTLQLVNYGLGVALHVKEVDAAVLTPGYYRRRRNQEKYGRF